MGYILTTYKLVSRISEPSTVCSCRCSGVVVPLWPLAVICRCSLQLLRWEPYSWKPPKFPSWLQFIQQSLRSLRSQAWGMLRNANLEAQLRKDFPIFVYYHEGWLLLFAQGAAAEFHDFAKTLWRERESTQGRDTNGAMTDLKGCRLGWLVFLVIPVLLVEDQAVNS